MIVEYLEENMNTFKSLLAILILLLCLSGFASAQGQVADRSIALMGMLGLPQSQNDLNELYGNGFGFGLEFKKHLINKTHLVMGFSNSMFPEDTDAIGAYYHQVMQDNVNARTWLTTQTTIGTPDTINAGGLAVQTFTVGLAQNLVQSNFNIYVTAAPGLYLYRYDKIDVRASRTIFDPENQTTEIMRQSIEKGDNVKFLFAFYGGIGFEMNLSSRIMFFAEGRYSYVRNPRQEGGAFGNVLNGIGGVRYAF